MIGSFGDAGTADLYHGRTTRQVRRYPRGLVKAALRKLDSIYSARHLRDLRAPPGNRLEALKGDLKGHHSIRVNDQWRLVFQWRDGAAHEVRLTDYH